MKLHHSLTGYLYLLVAVKVSQCYLMELSSFSIAQYRMNPTLKISWAFTNKLNSMRKETKQVGKIEGSYMSELTGERGMVEMSVCTYKGEDLYSVPVCWY